MTAIDDLHDQFAGIDEAVAWMNERFALAVVGGKPVVICDEHEPIDFWQRDALREYLRTRLVQTTDGLKPLVDVWLKSADRRAYRALDCVPGRERDLPGQIYNLWTGWTVEPAQGCCSLFLDYVLEVIARGDDDLYTWIICWLGDMVQNPREKPGTALCLTGKSGSGKTTFGELVGGMFHNHYVCISNPEQLVGRFNAHQRGVLLLHSDEAFYSNDMRVLGQLRSMVTQPDRLLELKGRDAVRMRDCCRILITGEDSKVVHASLAERRFCVVKVSDGRVNDRAYFAALHAQMAAGGTAALLYHLLNEVDPTDVNLREIPQTPELLEHKTRSLAPHQAWWLECLEQGYIGSVAGTWELEVPTRKARDAYLDYCRSHNERHPVAGNVLGQCLREMCPDLPQVNVRRKVNGKYEPHYLLPPLDAARARFEELFNSKLAWPEE